MRMEEWQRTHLPHSKGIMQYGEMLQTIELDRGCFTCMLGGADRKALFIDVLVATDPGGSLRGLVRWAC